MRTQRRALCRDASLPILLSYDSDVSPAGLELDYGVKKRLSLPLLVLVGWLFLEAPVDAYLDPGSGSMLLQILLGGFAAIGVVAKLYWHRVTSFFRRRGLPGG